METRSFFVAYHNDAGDVLAEWEISSVGQTVCLTNEAVRDAATNQFVAHCRRLFELPHTAVMDFEVKGADERWVQMSPELIITCHTGE
jgi:hypothetical protein